VGRQTAFQHLIVCLAIRIHVRYDEHMFADVDSGIAGLQRAATVLDIESLTGMEATRLVCRLGIAKRLTDAMLARAGLRVDDTKAYQGHVARQSLLPLTVHKTMPKRVPVSTLPANCRTCPK
jgi:hypothetical protein